MTTPSIHRTGLLLTAVLLLLTPVRGMGAAASGPGETVREPILAGTWYPAEPDRLKRTVLDFLDAAEVSEPPPERLLGLIVPHAGYRYSGPVAAHAYKLLEGREIDRVVILAPSHKVRFRGASVHPGTAYRTPLGTVPIDTRFVADLKKIDPRIGHVAEAHQREHALEIQLPFLQVAAPGAELVPVIMGDQDLDTCRGLAGALAEVIADRPALIVASTDLSHFHDDEKARRLDKVVLDHVRGLAPVELHRDLASGRCEACGAGPMVTALLAAEHLGADQSRVLRYATSGDATGDRDRVVGYMAAALFRSGAEKTKGAAGLTPAEREQLRGIARTAIEARLAGRAPGACQVDSHHLRTPRGAFVTLKKGGALRGCIGHIVGRLPLAETVRRMALAAAFQDPRFPPLTPAEIDGLEIEISVLTPLERVSDPGEIEVGTHGLLIRHGGRTGLLLPQVAAEQGWDRRRFLEGTCRKAGLPRDAWKAADAEIYRFSAQVF